MIYFDYPYFNKKTKIIGNAAIVSERVPIEKVTFLGSCEIINIGNPLTKYKMELIRETLPNG